MSTELITQSQDLVRQSTDIAGLCRQIVVESAITIQGRKYVKVEGWQAIATAHGCVASAKDVQRVEGGVIATGEIRRMSDGVLIATAEGYVGEDEPTWFGGGHKNLPKRPDYAIRAMAQTRAISRACRGCFAHIVVLMNAGLSTTPAEEVPAEGFIDVDPVKVIPAKPTKKEVILWPNVTMVSYEEIKGETKGREWIAGVCEFSNGQKAGTYSASAREILNNLMKRKLNESPMNVEVIAGKREGSFNLQSLEIIDLDKWDLTKD